MTATSENAFPLWLLWVVLVLLLLLLLCCLVVAMRRHYKKYGRSTKVMHCPTFAVRRRCLEHFFFSQRKEQQLWTFTHKWRKSKFVCTCQIRKTCPRNPNPRYFI